MGKGKKEPIQVKKGVTGWEITAFSPSSPPIEQAVKKGLELLNKEAPEIRIRMGEKERGGGPFPYLAGDDMSQAARFSALLTEGSSYLWAMRGGYGAMRWLPYVPEPRDGWRPPVVIGFSDVTFIHSWLVRRGACSIHGPMLSTLAATAAPARFFLYEVLLGGRFPDLQGEQVVPGACLGHLIGGNLTCLCHSIGTPLEPPWEGAILVIEDHNEAPYRIDRLLTHLLLSDRLKEVRGIAVGDLGIDRQQAIRVVEDRLAPLRIPIIAHLPVGHGEDNMPLLLGATYRIERGKLTPAWPGGEISSALQALWPTG